MSELAPKTALNDVELEERKRIIAHQIWEDEGRPEGLAEQHWERACLVVMSYTETEIPIEPEWLKPQTETSIAQTTIEIPKTRAEPTASIEEIRKHSRHRSAA